MPHLPQGSEGVEFRYGYPNSSNHCDCGSITGRWRRLLLQTRGAAVTNRSRERFKRNYYLASLTQGLGCFCIPALGLFFPFQIFETYGNRDQRGLAADGGARLNSTLRGVSFLIRHEPAGQCQRTFHVPVATIFPHNCRCFLLRASLRLGAGRPNRFDQRGGRPLSFRRGSSS
jgi:hypothetical protein